MPSLSVMLCQPMPDKAHTYAGASASVPDEKILRHHCCTFPIMLCQLTLTLDAGIFFKRRNKYTKYTA